jgi:glutamine synthetase type I
MFGEKVMAMSAQDVLQMIKDREVKFVDFRFTDTRGKEQHVGVPAKYVGMEKFEDGHAFDGSSIAGWKGIQASDMLLMPDPTTAFLDPFMDENTLVITCDVIEPTDGKGYDRDPRSIAKRAEAYLKSSGIGDTAYFGPEPEFFIFDSVNWQIDMSGCSVKINSEEAAWSSAEKFDGGNTGHRPGVKGGYFPVPPVDSLNDIRAAMCLALEDIGIEVEVHHHEVATAGQCEIGTKFNTLVRRADETQVLKYVVHNVAHQYGKTATFMPKPIVGDNGSGMHVHQSIWKLCGPVRTGALLHRRYHQTCQGIERDYQSWNQLIQASGAALRSTDQAGLFSQESFCLDSHSACAQRKGAPHRNTFPGSHRQSLFVFHSLDDGGPGRHPKQNSPGRPC